MAGNKGALGWGLLLALFFGSMILQVMSSREGFAATSPGTLTQLVTSRPVQYVATVPAWGF